MQHLPIRHGDVNLIPITPIQFRKLTKAGQAVQHKGSYILARGEATGSVHTLTCDDMQLIEVNGRLYVGVEGDATLTHTSDHETLEVPSGFYVQVPEREVDWFGEGVERKVLD